jgi:hypothetical protein
MIVTRIFAAEHGKARIERRDVPMRPDDGTGEIELDDGTRWPLHTQS